MTAPVPPAHLSFIDGIFFLRPVSSSIFEDDDLGVLAAELDDRVHFGMQLLHRERDALTSCTNLAPIRVGDARRRRSR